MPGMACGSAVSDALRAGHFGSGILINKGGNAKGVTWWLT